MSLSVHTVSVNARDYLMKYSVVILFFVLRVYTVTVLRRVFVSAHCEYLSTRFAHLYRFNVNVSDDDSSWLSCLLLWHYC